MKKQQNLSNLGNWFNTDKEDYTYGDIDILNIPDDFQQIFQRSFVAKICR